MSTPLKPTPEFDPDDPETRPIHDEWGVYDPEQAGFEAILRKLESAPKKRGSVWVRPASKPGTK